jgi:hypothetical protein
LFQKGAPPLALRSAMSDDLSVSGESAKRNSTAPTAPDHVHDRLALRGDRVTRGATRAVFAGMAETGNPVMLEMDEVNDNVTFVNKKCKIWPKP